MPQRPRNRRARGRRTQPPRVPPPPGAPPPSPAAEQPRRAARPAAPAERSTPFIGRELIRIGIVSAVCFGLLLALVAIDRMG